MKSAKKQKNRKNKKKLKNAKICLPKENLYARL